MTNVPNFCGKEQRVFDLLASKPGKVVSHLSIMEAIERRPVETLDYHKIGGCITNLKRQLQNTGYTLTNIKATGYILDPPREAA